MKRGANLDDVRPPGRRPGSKNRAPIGLASYVRAMTDDGRELVDFHLRVFRGEEAEVAAKGGVKMKVPATLDHRLQAADWLALRGYGRPKAEVELGEASRAPVERKPDGSLEAKDSQSAQCAAAGVLSAEEHAAGSKAMFDSMDTNKDAFVTLAELALGHQRMMRK
jgi:hypothetical protein